MLSAPVQELRFVYRRQTLRGSDLPLHPPTPISGKSMGKVIQPFSEQCFEAEDRTQVSSTMWAPVIPRALPVPSPCRAGSPMPRGAVLPGERGMEAGRKKQTPPQSKRDRGCSCEHVGAACLGKGGCAKGRLAQATCWTGGQQEAVEAAGSSERGRAGTRHDICLVHVGRHRRERDHFVLWLVSCLPHTHLSQPSRSPCFSHRQGWAQTLEGASGQQDRDGDVVSKTQSEPRNWSGEASRARLCHSETMAFSRSITVLVTEGRGGLLEDPLWITWGHAGARGVVVKIM